MFKTFFVARQPENTVDLELEHTMQLLHNRMERMLDTENTKRMLFQIGEKMPSCYKTH
jgi:hypothetical protein